MEKVWGKRVTASEISRPPVETCDLEVNPGTAAKASQQINQA